MSPVAAITSEHLERLHRSSIEDPQAIVSLLERAQLSRACFQFGLTKRILPERGWLKHLLSDSMVFRTENLELRANRKQLFLRFALDDQTYLFTAAMLRPVAGGIATSLPSVLYGSERRDRRRRAASDALEDGPQSVLLLGEGGEQVAFVSDWSPGGLGLRTPVSLPKGSEVAVKFVDGPLEGRTVAARVAYEQSDDSMPGWARIGVALGPGGASSLRLEERSTVSGSAFRSLATGWKTLAAATQVAPARFLSRLGVREATTSTPQIVRFVNRNGERLVGIVDSWGDTRGATAVIVPPAWGRTKETLLALARTLVASFAASGIPIVVLRYDGVRKRGESFRDPDLCEPGSENHQFTFSQGVRDIEAALDFLHSNPLYQPSNAILVTFSAASLEGRKALALEPKRIGGWICVVGSADLQSMMRTISGGIDYVRGVDEGISFGLQEILGVEVDIDLAGRDALEKDLAYVEDARQDFDQIRQPVTWYHGRFDAWMDFDRIRDVLAVGDPGNRSLIVVPTGHQLKSSREALELFQDIAREVSRMSLGRAVSGALPSATDLSGRSRAERTRLGTAAVDLRSFWRDYLVGREGTIGIELMTASSAYRSLMSLQIELMELGVGARILDLGAGVGSFLIQLSEGQASSRLTVLELDFVRVALRRGRDRFRGLSPKGIRAEFMEWDGRCGSLPLREGSVDVALASLVIGYLPEPKAVLRDLRRVLRPGGKLVLSSLKKDADISRIFMDGLQELTFGDARRRVSGFPAIEEVQEAARSFLNDAARLLDLEEAGHFAFWDEGELVELLREAGFDRVAVRDGFGDPPQALVASACVLSAA